MPSDTEMTAFAKSLPPIYRDILSSFPAIEPGRKARYGLAFQTLAMHFINTRKNYSLGEVQEACVQLASNGFLEIKNGIFAHPTDLGEQLIAVLAGTPRAPESRIPPLPARTW